MNKVELTVEQLQKAYKGADESGKKLLESLYGDIVKDNKPSLEDYKTIKTYEDACEALGIEPLVLENGVSFIGYGMHIYDLPRHIAALIKLETISRALWGKNWEPKPDAEGKEWCYYPWFALYTQAEIDEMSDEDKGALLSGRAVFGATAGFGYLDTDYRSSCAYAYFGFRLCQETNEKAAYFGKQFLELWAEYLAFNFSTGEILQ